MKLFRTDNTEGYSEEQMNKLNAEWEEIVSAEGLEEHTEKYEEMAKRFCDEVSRR